MKSITRSHATDHCDCAMQIYQEAAELLEHVEKHPIRLIGISIYNLSDEVYQQLTLDDFLEDAAGKRKDELDKKLDSLRERYSLDFAGHLEQIYHSMTLHRTIEYMRKHTRTQTF